MTASVGQVRAPASWDASLLFSALFVLLVIAGTRLGEAPALAVYALSFWHYFLYWLAYRYGAVALDVFKRDAMAMKTVALVALAYAYFSAPLDYLSLAVVASGFLLNIAAARVLGPERTYYGHEVANLPWRRITAFPYSWTAHPMLVGNIAAFGGTLINAEFRAEWWPLACAHVALNVGLLVMEVAVKPLRGGAERGRASDSGRPLIACCCIVAAGAVLGAALGHVTGWSAGTLLAAGLGACIAGYACVLHWRYTMPAIAPRARRFPATVGRFEDPAARATIDGLVKWVEERFREDLRLRPSKHVYVRKLPAAVIGQIDRIRDSDVIRGGILKHFGAGSDLVPMKHTDELYLSHYNKDGGGDQGLYDRHYDGNLRFLPFCPVVRALIYLQSGASYKVVFGDSRVEKAFTTYDFGLLDFHRELHWVEGDYNPDDQQRVLLKCNYLVSPPDGGLLTQAMLAANTGVFYVVKAAMEYSKSPANPPQYFVGMLCNLFREMNNLHPVVPLGFIFLVLVAAGWGIHRLVT